MQKSWTPQDSPRVRPFWELEAAAPLLRGGRLHLLWLLWVEEPALALGPAQRRPSPGAGDPPEGLPPGLPGPPSHLTQMTTLESHLQPALLRA